MKKQFARRSLIIGMSLAALGASFGASAQSNYPNRPVRIIVGFPAGTGPCLLYTSPSPRDTERSRMPSSA